MRRAAAAAIALAVAACFGGGPTPSAPSGATVVFSIPDTGDCSPSTYLGDVAFAGSAGVVVVSPVANPCNNNGGGNEQPPSSFVTFSLGGDDAGTTIGSVSVSSARVGWAGDQPVVAYSTTSSMASLQLGSATTSLGVPSPGGTQEPATIVDDGSAVWVAVWPGPNGASGGSLPDFDDPGFPDGASAFDSGASSGSGGYAFVKLAVDGTVQLAFQSAQIWFCDAMPDCLAESSASVFGMTRGGAGDLAAIVAFPKPTGAVDGDFAVVETIPATTVGSAALGPTGMAADDAHLAWVLSADPTSGQTGCEVFASDLAGGSATQLLATSKFSCAGAAVDGSGVYVAITQDHGGDTNSGDDTGIQGIGLARVGFDGTVASIATGITDIHAGPRRVYVAGDLLYAVDPHTLAAIPITAFDGAHDIAP